MAIASSTVPVSLNAPGLCPAEPAPPGWVSRLVADGVEHAPEHADGALLSMAVDVGAALVTARVPDVPTLDHDGLREAARSAYASILRRMETLADRPLIRKAYEDFRASKFRFQEMLVSLMVAREFPDDGAVNVSQREPVR